MTKSCVKCGSDFSTEEEADLCPLCEGAIVSARKRSTSSHMERTIRRESSDAKSDWYRSGVATTPFVSPEDVKRTLGVVTATVARGPGFFGEVLVNLKDAVGGRSGRTEVLFDELYQEVIAKIYERAAKVGGNSVIGLDVSVQEFGDKVFVLTAIGTAAIVG